MQRAHGIYQKFHLVNVLNPDHELESFPTKTK